MYEHHNMERILAKLRKAAQLPRPIRHQGQRDQDVGDFFRFFGADHHNFRLNPPISSGAVEDWEEKYRATLPLAYRTFLEQAGDGGAGPDYGLLPLDRWDDGCCVGIESLHDWPSTPCPLVEDFLPDLDRDAWLAKVGGPDWGKPEPNFWLDWVLTGDPTFFHGKTTQPSLD